MSAWHGTPKRSTACRREAGSGSKQASSDPFSDCSIAGPT